jgi:hypothetical protein
MYILQKDKWYLERILFLIAGIFILISIALSLIFSLYWLILTGLIGLNLIIFASTGFCPSANLLYKLGAKPRLQQNLEKNK